MRPTLANIESYVKELLKTADLDECSLKTIRAKLFTDLQAEPGAHAAEITAEQQ